MSINSQKSGKISKSATSKKLHKELTGDEKLKLGAPNVGTLFAGLNSEINSIWEDYTAINFYLSKVHEQIKSRSLECLAIPRLVLKPRMQRIDANAVFGIIGRIRTKTAGRHAFIDAIGTFENFISKLVFKIYLDFPDKLRSFSPLGEVESAPRQKKLIDIIFESDDRYEMIHKLVEERVRGIFYGNPVDLFAKDKAGIGFGDHFKNNHVSLLNSFREMTARRNIIVHNEGRIDRKYMLEVSSSNFQLGQKIDIDEVYLRRSLLTMKVLAADAAQLASTNVYKEPLHGAARTVQTAAKKQPIL